jgi:transcriptional regulator with XRE-family HTH domain
MNADRFAGRLRQLREQAGLSQKALAEKAGLVTSAIGHLEQGLRKPTWETVLALARVLGVSCSAFESDEGPAPEEMPRPRGRPKRNAGQGETEPKKKPKRKR